MVRKLLSGHLRHFGIAQDPVLTGLDVRDVDRFPGHQRFRGASNLFRGLQDRVALASSRNDFLLRGVPDGVLVIRLCERERIFAMRLRHHGVDVDAHRWLSILVERKDAGHHAGLLERIGIRFDGSLEFSLRQIRLRDVHRRQRHDVLFAFGRPDLAVGGEGLPATLVADFLQFFLGGGQVLVAPSLGAGLGHFAGGADEGNSAGALLFGQREKVCGARIRNLRHALVILVNAHPVNFFQVAFHKLLHSRGDGGPIGFPGFHRQQAVARVVVHARKALFEGFLAHHISIYPSPVTGGLETVFLLDVGVLIEKIVVPLVAQLHRCAIRQNPRLAETGRRGL